MLILVNAAVGSTLETIRMGSTGGTMLLSRAPAAPASCTAVGQSQDLPNGALSECRVARVAWRFLGVQ